MDTRVSSPTFVGRRTELGRLETALAAARAGHPGVMVIAGEAGVGKTRLVSELAASARASEARVLEGGCVPVGTEGLPFEPLIEALRGLSRELPDAALDELMGPGRAELARLMPELLRDHASADPGLTDSSVQGRLFEQLLLFLDRLAGQAPVVLVIEDAHWADRSSLEVLGFLIRNLRRQRVLVLLTYRSDELDRRQPLMPFLAELERSGRGERVELTRFDRVRPRRPAPWDPRGGPGPNAGSSDPRALGWQRLLCRGATGQRGRGDLPDSLRDVLLAKLATLSESTLEFVRVASAGGARVSSGLVGIRDGDRPTRP